MVKKKSPSSHKGAKKTVQKTADKLGRKVKKNISKIVHNIFHPSYAVAIVVLELLFSFLIVRYIDNIFSHPVCRNIDPRRRELFYYLAWANVIIALISLIFNGALVSYADRVQAGLYSSLGTTLTAVVNVIITSMLIHYLQSLYNEPECREVDHYSRQMLYFASSVFLLINLALLATIAYAYVSQHL